MFPLFELFPGFIIYTFWITITICFFAFLWMLKKLSTKFWYDYTIFTKNILWYFLSVFFFSRLFYVISRWTDLRHIQNPFEFFIMNEFNFSLMWAIFGFFLVLYINMRLLKQKAEQYIDGVVISFLFIAFIWYIWALLWWEVYGRETNFWIEILYNHAFTPVPYQVPVFPLPIVYAIMSFILFSALYILSIFVHIRSLLWYIWLAIFSSILIIFEFFSGKYDILKDSVWINLTQLWALMIIILCWYKLFLLARSNK